MERSALTEDDYLGGRVTVTQPRDGYRAGVDAVLLAASVPAASGQTCLELGCGAGVASLCLGTRVPGLSLFGVEVQTHYADLARQNADRANVTMDVITASLDALPQSLKDRSFDHVMLNPPYYRPGARQSASNPGRERALGEVTPLSTWIETALRRLAPRGVLSVILRIDRLPDVLSAIDSRAGAVQVLPVQPREAREPGHFILRARKSRKTPFRLLSPLILHAGIEHQRDEDSYTPEVSAILRDGAPLQRFAD